MSIGEPAEIGMLAHLGTAGNPTQLYGESIMDLYAFQYKKVSYASLKQMDSEEKNAQPNKDFVIQKTYSGELV